MSQTVIDNSIILPEQWVGVVSHDLRTPLAAIRIGIDILGIAELDPRLARLVGQMDDAASRAQRLIEDLLEFTQVRQGGKVVAVRESIDLHTCVSEAIEEFSLAFPNRTFIHNSYGSGRCSADRDRLIQSLGNLVSNAVTYGMPDRPITVTSGAIGGQCILEVHNVGTINADDLSTLFDPMVRLDRQWSKERSVGLGLFIVREIARAHAGDVNVASSIAQGTTFAITFPAC